MLKYNSFSIMGSNCKRFENYFFNSNEYPVNVVQDLLTAMQNIIAGTAEILQWNEDDENLQWQIRSKNEPIIVLYYKKLKSNQSSDISVETLRTHKNAQTSEKNIQHQSINIQNDTTVVLSVRDKQECVYDKSEMFPSSQTASTETGEFVTTLSDDMDVCLNFTGSHEERNSVTTLDDRANSFSTRSNINVKSKWMIMDDCVKNDMVCNDLNLTSLDADIALSEMNIPSSSGFSYASKTSSVQSSDAENNCINSIDVICSSLVNTSEKNSKNYMKIIKHSSAKKNKHKVLMSMNLQNKNSAKISCMSSNSKHGRASSSSTDVDVIPYENTSKICHNGINLKDHTSLNLKNANANLSNSFNDVEKSVGERNELSRFYNTNKENNFFFSRHNEENKILKVIHKYAGSFMCSVCGKVFSKIASKCIHEREHKKFILNFHSCSYCDKRFYSKSAKSIHERIHAQENM